MPWLYSEKVASNPFYSWSVFVSLKPTVVNEKKDSTMLWWNKTRLKSLSVKECRGFWLVSLQGFILHILLFISVWAKAKNTCGIRSLNIILD